MQDIEQQPTPKCPTCGSTDIRKIGSVERGASIFALVYSAKRLIRHLNAITVDIHGKDEYIL